MFNQKWKNYKFDELFDFEGSYSASREELGDEGVAYLHYGDMHTSNKNYVDVDKDFDKLPKYKVKGEPKFLLNDGDLVFVDASEDYPGTCKTFLVKNKTKKQFVAGLHTLIAKPKLKVVSDEFRKYLTEIPSVRKQIYKLVQGYKVYGINRENLKLINVELPEFKISEKIAEILDTWARAVELQEQKVEKLKEKKKALMQKLLIPKTGWLKLPLKEIMDFYNGYTFKSETYCDGCDGKYKVITIANVKNGEMVIDKNTSTIDELPENIRDFQILSKGDILISMTGNVGRVCKVDEDDCLLNQRVGKIVVKKNFSSDFVYYALQTYDFIEKMMIFAQGAAQDNMSVKDVNRYKCWIPKEIAEQKKIANILLSLDKKIILNKNLLNQYYQQQKALMQKLLTGEIRVNG